MALYSSSAPMGMHPFLIVGEGTDQRTNTTWRDLIVRAQSPLFEGHFPNHPILPGVCLLDAALALLRRMGDVVGPNIKVSSMRIKSPLTPHDRVRLTLDMSGDAISAKFTKGSVQVAHMKLESSAKSGPQPIEAKNPAELKLSAFVDRYLNGAVARLPHSAPVHLVDTARLLDDGTLISRRYLDSAEPWFAADAVTSSGPRVAPVSMIVESFLQSSALLLDSGDEKGINEALPVFGSLRGLEILGSAYAGSSIFHTVTTKIRAGNSLIVCGETHADGVLVCRYSNVALAIRDWNALVHLPRSTPDIRAA